MNPQQPQIPQFQPPTGSPTGASLPPQQGNPQVDKANQAAASLAFATHLQTQLMQHQAPQMAQNGPQSSQTGDTENPTEEKSKKEEPDITKTLTDFKTEIEGMLDSKLGDIKRELETLMSEEEQDEPTKDNEKAETPTAA